MDKWLWQARFFKTRSLAARQVGDGHVRVNAVKVTKTATPVSPGDVLTFAQGRQIRVVKIEALAKRRGPAAEAQALYTDMTPEAEPVPPRVGPRPTKKDRRDMDAFREEDD
ncbi:RNA-binding S4 domain-containing protein [Rhodobacteraceae bacterium N5(2021)]|uniref:RNA-binding S4 domain-containing protein n=1 Tax=Gymnodinialimonas phycosphaerae TaxID=2841589 RepID=A0A975YI26_9RHOB|nr:RNA-binding S4 domain-containing protein [Gymnodinialimonas phycosphaerae]MBY4893106.1 RNA-binding S4 domain-containing protein [Gymnodinialimonas phycosphaerae]